MTDYASNSKKSKEEQQEKVVVEKKVIEKVVTGKVVAKKPSVAEKFKNIFFGSDMKSAGKYVLAEVLLPAFRNMVAETGKAAIDRAIYGEASYPTRRQRTNYQSRAVYNPANPGRHDPRIVYETTGRERAHIPDQPMRPRSRRGGLEFICQTRADAEAAIEKMDFLIGKFDQASIADLYEALGLEEETEWTDQRWGWDVLKDVEIRQIREGFLLEFPPAEPLQ